MRPSKFFRVTMLWIAIRGWDSAHVFDSRQQVRVDQRAVFDPVTGIIAWPQVLHALVGVQSHIDRDIAVGMDADLPSVSVGVFDRFVNFLLRHRQNAVFVGPADMRCTHSHRARRRRTVRSVLHSRDLRPRITETQGLRVKSPHGSNDDIQSTTTTTGGTPLSPVPIGIRNLFPSAETA